MASVETVKKLLKSDIARQMCGGVLSCLPLSALQKN